MSRARQRRLGTRALPASSPPARPLASCDRALAASAQGNIQISSLQSMLDGGKAGIEASDAVALLQDVPAAKAAAPLPPPPQTPPAPPLPALPTRTGEVDSSALDAWEDLALRDSVCRRHRCQEARRMRGQLGLRAATPSPPFCPPHRARALALPLRLAAPPPPVTRVLMPPSRHASPP